jgi:hypothetical protein
LIATVHPIGNWKPGKLPAAEWAPQNVLAVSQPRDFIDGRAGDAMADLTDQRRVINVEKRIEEVLSARRRAGSPAR